MWHAVYYEKEGGECPVMDFIEWRKKSNQAKILAWISLLEERGPNLPRPYADLLEDGIHELRITLSKDNIRILYFFCFKEFIVLTNWFNKTTSQVPEEQISEAKRCREDFFKRISEEQLRRMIRDENIPIPP